MPGLSSGRTWALPARLLFILAALLALPALTACRPAPPLVQLTVIWFMPVAAAETPAGTGGKAPPPQSGTARWAAVATNALTVFA